MIKYLVTLVIFLALSLLSSSTILIPTVYEGMEWKEIDPSELTCPNHEISKDYNKNDGFELNLSLDIKGLSINQHLDNKLDIIICYKVLLETTCVQNWYFSSTITYTVNRTHQSDQTCNFNETSNKIYLTEFSEIKINEYPTPSCHWNDKTINKKPFHFFVKTTTYYDLLKNKIFGEAIPSTGLSIVHGQTEYINTRLGIVYKIESDIVNNCIKSLEYDKLTLLFPKPKFDNLKIDLLFNNELEEKEEKIKINDTFLMTKYSKELLIKTNNHKYTPLTDFCVEEFCGVNGYKHKRLSYWFSFVQNDKIENEYDNLFKKTLPICNNKKIVLMDEESNTLNLEYQLMTDLMLTICLNFKNSLSFKSINAEINPQLNVFYPSAPGIYPGYIILNNTILMKKFKFIYGELYNGLDKKIIGLVNKKPLIYNDWIKVTTNEFQKIEIGVNGLIRFNNKLSLPKIARDLQQLQGMISDNSHQIEITGIKLYNQDVAIQFDDIKAENQQLNTSFPGLDLLSDLENWFVDLSQIFKIILYTVLILFLIIVAYHAYRCTSKTRRPTNDVRYIGNIDTLHPIHAL